MTSEGVTLLRRTCRVATLVTLMLLLGVAVFAQAPAQDPRQPEDRAEQPATQPPDPRGTEALPFIVKVEPAPQTAAEAAEEQRQKEQEAADRLLTRRVAIGTVVIGLLQVIAIGFQVFIARRQNSIIERQNTIMTEQRDAAKDQSGYMRDGLKETRKAADAAEASVTIALAHKRIGDKQLAQMDAQIEISRMNAEAAMKSAQAAEASVTVMQSAERPYIRWEIVPISVIRLSEVLVTVKLTNVGKTPARLGFGHLKILSDLTNREILPYLPEECPPSQPYLLPGEVSEWTQLFIEITDKDLDHRTATKFEQSMPIERPLKTSLRLLGRIEYRDNYDNWYGSTFGRRLVGDGGPAPQRPGGWLYSNTLVAIIDGSVKDHNSDTPKQT